MPRRVSLGSRNYAAGTYGPFVVDNFTKHDTDRLHWTFTVENWDPLADPILTVVARWSDGTEWGVAYSGAPVNRDGTPASMVSGDVQVPRLADENGNRSKVDVASGTITVTCHVALRTAITFDAVSA